MPVSLPELEQHLWGAANILRGSIDSGEYKSYIFGLLFFKRLSDVWQEEYEAKMAEYHDAVACPYRVCPSSEFSGMQRRFCNGGSGSVSV